MTKVCNPEHCLQSTIPEKANEAPAWSVILTNVCEHAPIVEHLQTVERGVCERPADLGRKIYVHPTVRPQDCQSRARAVTRQQQTSVRRRQWAVKVQPRQVRYKQWVNGRAE